MHFGPAFAIITPEAYIAAILPDLAAVKRMPCLQRAARLCSDAPPAIIRNLTTDPDDNRENSQGTDRRRRLG
jgi:hypothetical protein